MNELGGTIKISRRLAGHKVWQREPKCAGAAWVDLLLLANDKPADVFLHGEQVHLERGQLGWAILSLSDRWRRSREWTTKFLRDLQDDGQIVLDANRRRTIITICNYDAFQTSEPTTDEATEPATASTTEQAQNGNGKGNEKKNGEGEVPPVEIPSDDEVKTYCAQHFDLARGIHGIPELWWRGWLANALSRPQFPRGWQRCLVNAFIGDWVSGHPKARGQNFLEKKIPPPGMATHANGDVPLPPGYAPADFSKMQ